ncbi:hypothetical protein [Actinomyces wuliandei]|uniref:hypothetical protein n=1 Tax=Actinomyces wuliandei TaxID=2057743 RepID=UPI000FD9538A|nr:hypothetical protein [Actinomyces wuliandei]
MSQTDPPEQLTRRLLGNTVSMAAPETWDQLDATALADITRTIALPADSAPDALDLVCAGPSGVPGFADNCVVTAVSLPTTTSDAEWFQESSAQVLAAIPGVRPIDMAQWNGDHVTGLMRSGVYIMDNRSLTFTQWSWVQGPVFLDTGVRRGMTATFTTPTLTCGTSLPLFTEMADTLNVFADPDTAP